MTFSYTHPSWQWPSWERWGWRQRCNRGQTCVYAHQYGEGGNRSDPCWGGDAHVHGSAHPASLGSPVCHCLRWCAQHSPTKNSYANEHVSMKFFKLQSSMVNIAVDKSAYIWNTLQDFCPKLHSGEDGASCQKSEPVSDSVHLEYTNFTENQMVYEEHRASEYHCT